ncbi:hypothetical protein QJS10_CPA07g00943 [Acorus calamus]|uniref:Uncharacterized protein n=1 Tax=Acorus calamus TaxID=4465 RepID=A0AAV9EJB5_ACOCL|nr:hypothetical protein QJS10_CPA07g00943 [Acorus calamus]
MSRRHPMRAPVPPCCRISLDQPPVRAPAAALRCQPPLAADLRPPSTASGRPPTLPGHPPVPRSPSGRPRPHSDTSCRPPTDLGCLLAALCCPWPPSATSDNPLATLRRSPPTSDASVRPPPAPAATSGFQNTKSDLISYPKICTPPRISLRHRPPSCSLVQSRDSLRRTLHTLHVPFAHCPLLASLRASVPSHPAFSASLLMPHVRVTVCVVFLLLILYLRYALPLAFAML